MPNSTTASTPLIIMCAFPASGHMQGPLQITSYLASRGHTIFFLTGPSFHSQALSAGATEVWDNTFGALTPSLISAQHSYPQGHLRWNYQQKHIFLTGASARHAILSSCLSSLHERYPGRKVVIFNEVFFLGAMPYLLGKPYPEGQQVKVINFHTTINWLVSNEIGPYTLCLPPAETDAVRERYGELYEEMRPEVRKTVEYANAIFRELGATRDVEGDFLFSELLRLPEVVLLACSPSLEYPRRDGGGGGGGGKVRYIGGLPRKKGGEEMAFPAWWDEMEKNAARAPDDPGRKTVVLVSQGTANNDDYGELLVPTMEAFTDREDVLVVATLGQQGKKLPDDVLAAVPPNTRVVDYMPYDAVLPLADVFVFNGGYGGFMHGVMNGTPMIIAGTAADKGEVAARAEWAGVAINLRTGSPTPTMLRDALDRVVGDGKLKAKAMEIKEENEKMDALGAIEKLIWQLSE